MAEDSEPLCPECGRRRDEGNIHDTYCDDTHGPDDDCADFICENPFHQGAGGVPKPGEGD